MSLSKKDYVLLAGVVRKTVQHYNLHLPAEVEEFLDTLMAEMVEALERENPRFQREKFFKAVYGV